MGSDAYRESLKFKLSIKNMNSDPYRYVDIQEIWTKEEIEQYLLLTGTSHQHMDHLNRLN